MRNIFIDCGAHTGESVKLFMKRVVNADKYSIHSFEPNPRSAQIFRSSCGQFKNVTLYEKAAWIDDCVLDFFLGSSAGCTLIKEKTSGNLDKDNPVKVEATSLSKFIINNFNRSDNIVLKIDIEGAEYNVIPDLIKTGAINYIKQLFGEWHFEKIGFPKEKHDNLVLSLRTSGLKMREWCAITGVIGD